MVTTDNYYFYIVRLGKLNYIFRGPKGRGMLTHILVCVNEKTNEHKLESLGSAVDSNDGRAIKEAIEKDSRKPSYFGSTSYDEAKKVIYIHGGPGALILDRLSLKV